MAETNQDCDTRSVVLRRGDGLLVEYDRARLVVEAGPDQGAEFPLGEGPLVVGRGAEADLVLRDGAASRAHARLVRRGAAWAIEDLGSKAGVRVDGARVGQAELRPDARILLGETELVLRVERAELRAPAAGPEVFHGLAAESPGMLRLFGLLRQLAPLDLPVLLTGESGTGKEGLAQALHRGRGEDPGPFVVVDCGLLAGEHLRSELFGHVRGAFTGATSARPGAMTQADGGTVFLDEVGELPLELQPTLLRTLQEGEVRPLGADRGHRVRVRVVAATNRDLRAEVAAGRFRQDLYYRLAGVEVDVPPLRERPGDVEALARHLLVRPERLGPAVVAALERHPWPGNVRELVNTLRRAEALAGDGPLEVAHLGLPGSGGEAAAAPPVLEPGPASDGTASLEDQVVAEEARILRAALERAGGNRSAAARALGISRATLYRKLSRAGIE